MVRDVLGVFMFGKLKAELRNVQPYHPSMVAVLSKRELSRLGGQKLPGVHEVLKENSHGPVTTALTP